MPPKAVWVVATLLGFVLCAVAQDVTLQENRHALTMHPLVMETLMFACSERRTDWKCFPKQTEYSSRCRAYAKSLASSQDQEAALQHCFMAFTPSRRSDAEIRKHPDDGPIYLKYLKEYVEANVVVQEEKKPEHPPASTTQPPPDSEIPGSGHQEKPGLGTPGFTPGFTFHKPETKKSVLNWFNACVLCVIVFVLAVLLYCVVSWKNKDCAKRILTAQAASTSETGKLKSQIAALQAELETEKSAGETPSCYTRLCKLNIEELKQVCRRLEVSTQKIDKMAGTKSWSHDKKCLYIFGECGLLETQITAVLDEYFPTKKSSTSPSNVPSQLPNRSQGGGWGGRSGVNNARNDNTNTDDTARMARTAPATGLQLFNHSARQNGFGQFQQPSTQNPFLYEGQNVNGLSHLRHLYVPATTMNGVPSQDPAPSSHIPALGITMNGVPSQDLAPLIQIPAPAGVPSQDLAPSIQTPAPAGVPSQDQALSEHTLGKRKGLADGPNEAVSGQVPRLLRKRRMRCEGAME